MGNNLEFNKLGLEPGETIMLDKNFRNGSLVVIESITPKGIYSEIYSKEIFEKTGKKHTWTVMTYRLTRKNEEEIK